MNQNFQRSDITRQKSFFTFNVLFDVLIFDILNNHFVFNVLIILKILSMVWTFDVLILDVPTASQDIVEQK